MFLVVELDSGRTRSPQCVPAIASSLSLTAARPSLSCFPHKMISHLISCFSFSRTCLGAPRATRVLVKAVFVY